MQEEYDRRWADKTRPYPGVPELLAALSEQDVQLAVLSNKPDAFTKMCVKRFFPHTPFKPVYGASESIPHKPDPTGAKRVCTDLGLNPAAFLYVGDTGTDMRTAGAAEMYAVGALWGFRTANELRENGAQSLIERPGALLSLLET